MVPRDAPRVAAAEIAGFAKGERTSGFHKICVYDCLGSPTSITINSVALRPLTVRR